MKPARNHKGQYSPRYTPLQLFVATLMGIWMCYTAGIYIDNQKLTAQVNYLTAYSKSIEQKGLAHWNTMYDYSTNRYEKPSDVEGMIDFVFGKDAPIMKKIAKCESGLKPTAKNGKSSARGVFQVLAYTHDVNEKWLYDPFINTLIAKRLFDASGTNPWNASIKCWGK
jgi:hypothetical protein